MPKQRAPKVYVDEPVEPVAYRRTLIGFTARESIHDKLAAGPPGERESLAEAISEGYRKAPQGASEVGGGLTPPEQE